MVPSDQACTKASPSIHALTGRVKDFPESSKLWLSLCELFGAKVCTLFGVPMSGGSRSFRVCRVTSTEARLHTSNI